MNPNRQHRTTKRKRKHSHYKGTSVSSRVARRVAIARIHYGMHERIMWVCMTCTSFFISEAQSDLCNFIHSFQTALSQSVLWLRALETAPTKKARFKLDESRVARVGSWVSSLEGPSLSLLTFRTGIWMSWCSANPRHRASWSGDKYQPRQT